MIKQMKEKKIRIRISKETKMNLDKLKDVYGFDNYSDLLMFLLERYGEKMAITKPEHNKLNGGD